MALTCCGDYVEVEVKWGFLLRSEVRAELGAPGVCNGVRPVGMCFPGRDGG